MKFPVRMAAPLAACAFATFPLYAQDDMGVPAPPPPENGPYVAPDQAPPPGDYAPPADPPADQGQSGADQPATFQTFYDNLAPQGTWIQSADYGYVWQPAVNDPAWAPYTNGHWVYSDAGWTWVSDEPWGWATYHYGRWVNLDGTGWCWVPGYTWAPAWVSWRYGSGYCGWAPLPPESFVGIDYIGSGIQITGGFHIGGDCDNYYSIGAGWYHFMPVSCLGYTNYRGHYANWQNNYVIINRTTNVTNLNVNRNFAGNGSNVGFSGVTTGGPSLAQVNAASATPVPSVHLTGARRPGGGGQLANNSLAVFAPRVAPGTNHNFQPSRVGGSVNRPTINRGVDVTRPLSVNQTLSAPTPTPGQIQQAQLAQYAAPLRAHVATTSTPSNPALQTPLTSLQPVPVVAPQTAQGRAFSNAPHIAPSANVTAIPPQTQLNNGWGNRAAETTNPPNHAFNQGAHPVSNNPAYHSWGPSSPQPQAQPTAVPPNVFNRQAQPTPSYPSSGSHPQITPTQQTQPMVPPNGYHHDRQVESSPNLNPRVAIPPAPAPATPQPQVQSTPVVHPFNPQPQTQQPTAPGNPNLHQQAPQSPSVPSPAVNGNNGNQGATMAATARTEIVITAMAGMAPPSNKITRTHGKICRQLAG